MDNTTPEGFADAHLSWTGRIVCWHCPRTGRYASGLVAHVYVHCGAVFLCLVDSRGYDLPVQAADDVWLSGEGWYPSR